MKIYNRLEAIVDDWIEKHMLITNIHGPKLNRMI